MSKTVFVLGAGSSQEAKLPVGSELKKHIASSLDIWFEDFRQTRGDRAITAALSLAAAPSRDIGPFQQAAWRIRDAMPQAISIDHYIDAHSGDSQVEICGKLAIVRSILEAEAKSSINANSSTVNPSIHFEEIENTWFNPFFRLLTEDCRKADIEKRISSVALIVFNYDRCIEHYLYYALQRYYAISDRDAADLLRKMDIFHPYGRVGSLPWLDPINAVEFGGTPDPRLLFTLSGQIKTFTEGTNAASSDILKIRDLMTDANKIVFLGFAFHRLNLDLLLPIPGSSGQNVPCPIIASALGISVPDTEHIARDLISRWGGKRKASLQIRSGFSCARLFSEHWRSLSLV